MGTVLVVDVRSSLSFTRGLDASRVEHQPLSRCFTQSAIIVGSNQASATNPPLSQSDPQTLQPSEFVILAVNAGFAAAAEAWGELDFWMLVFRRKFLL